MMDPTREPSAPRDILSDDAVVSYLRARAPGLPTAPFDPRAVTSRARGALVRLRRRRLRNSAVALAGAITAYLAIALAGPVPVPGLGPVGVPGDAGVRAMVRGLIPGVPPGPDQWHGDVDRLEADVLPVVEELEVSYYLLESGPCVFEYSRGDYSDPECGELMPFDAEARADFDRVTDAIERSGVAVERLGRDRGGLYVRLEDYSVQYNYEYVSLPDVDSPPATMWPGEAWTHIRGDWWFHRAHDD